MCYLSLVMKKPAFCICENKDADRLRGKREADQRLFFRSIASAILLLPKYKISSLFYDCTARFVSDQVRNPEDRFSHNEAYLIMMSVSKLSSPFVFADDCSSLSFEKKHLYPEYYVFRCVCVFFDGCLSKI